MLPTWGQRTEPAAQTGRRGARGVGARAPAQRRLESQAGGLWLWPPQLLNMPSPISLGLTHSLCCQCWPRSFVQN